MKKEALHLSEFIRKVASQKHGADDLNMKGKINERNHRVRVMW